MKLLLDTHTFLWMSLDDPQLSDAARSHIGELDNQLFLSLASVWEIGIKIAIGKLEVTEELRTFIDREVQRNSLTLLPITVAHADTITRLPFHHKDPFDRLLIAQAMCEDIPILSCDSAFAIYDVNCIW